MQILHLLLFFLITTWIANQSRYFTSMIELAPNSISNLLLTSLDHSSLIFYHVCLIDLYVGLTFSLRTVMEWSISFISTIDQAKVDNFLRNLTYSSFMPVQNFVKPGLGYLCWCWFWLCLFWRLGQLSYHYQSKLGWLRCYWLQVLPLKDRCVACQY